MKILSANWLFTCDENSSIIKDGAIVFDKKILEVDTFTNLKKKYPNEQIEYLGENSVLMPGLINSHVHLEFSANTTSLKYGDFISWLNSVIENREKLLQEASKDLINQKLKKMLKTGTTTIGAISSYSFDLIPCINTPINTVFFIEVIGSKADMVDALFSDFKARLQEAKKHKSNSFIPAVAIHSPYSVHPFLVRESLNIAKENNLSISSHFLESQQEYDWLHKSSGGFLEFFRTFLGQNESVTKPIEFLNQFKGVKNLSFTHCVEASKKDLDKIKELNASINHCPTSNRLLNNSKLDISKIKDINISIGTDGLSSNNSLSMFDELRNALFIHTKKNIISFANKLLVASTKGGAKALGLQKGSLKKGLDADLIYFSLPNKVTQKEDLAMHIILHTNFVEKTIIGGEYV